MTINSNKTHILDMKEVTKLFPGFLNSTDEAVFIVHPTTAKLLAHNKKACDCLGYTSEEMMSLSFKSIVFEFKNSNYGEWITMIDQLRASNGPCCLHSYQLQKDGSWEPVTIKLSLHLCSEVEYLCVKIKSRPSLLSE